MPTTCDPSVSGVDHMIQFEFIKGVVCEYAIPAGGIAVVGLIVYGAIASSIYIRTGSVIIPLGLLLLTGGAVMAQMAAPGVGFAAILLLVGSAGIVAYLYYRWSI